MAQRLHHRIAALAAVALLCATIGVTRAHAQICCTAYIDNLSTCTGFTVNYVGGGSRTIGVGSNLFFFTTCVDPQFTITDFCGNVVPFPVGGFTDVKLPGGCCIRITNTATNPCLWEITNIACPIC